MIIHHINCGCMCPWIAKVLPRALPKTFCCHCWVIEAGDRLVLVDTGVSTIDCDHPERIGLTHHLFNFQFKKSETAKHQLQDLGYTPDDVTDIILTHLDSDHASGLCDFPQATVHVSQQEFEAAQQQTTLQHRLRYRPHYLHDQVQWSTIDLTQGESWMTFSQVQECSFLDDVLLINLSGHTPGHMGIAVNTETGWLLHAGDAYFNQSVISQGRQRYPLLSFFERRVHMNAAQAQDRLQAIQALPDDFDVICSHDASFFPDLVT